MAPTRNAISDEGLRACWLLIVDRHRWGNRRQVDLAHVDILSTQIQNGEETAAADKRRLSLAKKLMQCPEIRAIEQLFREATDWLFANGLPSFMRPGIYRIPPGLISTVDEKLRGYQGRLATLVDAASDVYPERCAEGLAALGDLGNANDYPSVEEFRTRWGLGWRWVSVGVPDALKAVDYQLWKAERDKEAAQIHAAAEGVRVLLRQTALSLVRQLHDKLTPGVGGKKRILRKTALDELQQFVTAFSFRDVTNDRELADVVAQIQELARGVDVPQLRDDGTLRARVEREASRLSGHLDRLVVETPTRRLRVRSTSKVAA